MADFAGEKNLEPTPHRRQQARREGHVAKSRDLGSAVLLLAGLAALMSLGGGLVGFMVQFCREQLGGQAWLTTNPQMVVEQWNHTIWTIGRLTLPLLGLICLVGVAVHVLQGGFLFLPQRLTLDFSRLDPLRGFRRIFSGNGMVQLGFGVLKFVIVLVVAGAVIYHERADILRLTELSPASLGVRVAGLLFATSMKVGAALLVLAILDYGYQWWRHEQDLKMTPQELREELRNLEGNPQTIARRKQVRRDWASKRSQID
jgi:flagellar biosynthetic protein FlhB